MAQNKAVIDVYASVHINRNDAIIDLWKFHSFIVTLSVCKIIDAWAMFALADI